MKRTISLVVMVALISSGCASIFHGTKERISVHSEEPDTHFFCNSRDLGIGKMGFVTIDKKELSSSVLRAEKGGCATKTAQIATSFDGITLLGILIDYGLISILVVDWGVNGSVVRASQIDYNLTPDCPKQQPLQQTQPLEKPI
jgi:hypothetical protein